MVENTLKKIKNKEIMDFVKYSIRHPINLATVFDEKQNRYWSSESKKIVLNKVKAVSGIKSFKYSNVTSGYIEQKTFNGQAEFLLAGQKVILDLSNIQWDRKFDDAEDAAAFYRFMWLYRFVIENINLIDRETLLQYSKNVIYSWIDFYKDKNKEEVHSEVWQTYSVAERVFNWIFILALLSPECINDKIIINSIIKQACYIQENLEYYGERFTGNHLTNDGRGLYTVGAMLGLNEFRELGCKLIKNEYDRVIYKPGYLREGSSHYQILYTKWFTDLYWIALCVKDNEFEKWIEPRLKDLVICSESFFSYDKNGFVDMDFWGDISPDHPPMWIIGAPAVARKLMGEKVFDFIPQTQGFHSLLNMRKEEGEKFEGKTYVENEEWGRIENENCIVHGRVFSNIYPNNAPGHFHKDTGSFTLKYKGKKIIVDAGRCNYSGIGASKYQKDFYGHNQIVIDGTSSEIDMRRFYTQSFLNYYVGEKPKIECIDNTEIKMTYFEGKKVKNISSCTRKILLHNNEVDIEDFIEGRGFHWLQFAIHLHPDFSAGKLENVVWITDGEMNGEIYYAPKGKVELISGDNLYCNYSEKYGQNNKTSTVILFTQYVKLPYLLKTKICIKEKL